MRKVELRKEWCPIYSRMEEHIVAYRCVSAAKGKLKVKRPRQSEDGHKLEDLRSELDNLTSLLALLPLEESEEPNENLSAELDRLPSPTELLEPKELEEPEEAKDLEELKDLEDAESKESKEAEEQEGAEEHAQPKEAEEIKEQEDPKESEEDEELEELEEAEEQEEAEEHAERKEAEEAKEQEDPKESEEDEEHAQPKEVEGPKEEDPKKSARTLDGLINREVLRSKTVQTWYQDLLCNLSIVSELPKVIKSTFRDARKLFDVNRDNKVTLRNAGYIEGYEDIVLLQFDPNFMSTEVVCRHPSCNNINPAAAKCGKRDLYLCPRHQQVLRNNITDAFAKKSVQNPTSLEKPEPGQFAGYTSLISLLEVAYRDPKNLKVQEVILHVRNFLIITSTLLNPDHDNLGIALPPVFEIFKFILENRENIECLAEKAIPLLKEVIGMILSDFGIVYTWVSDALGNPGAQIGAGVGGFIGGWTSLATGPLGWLSGISAGFYFGGLIGNGLYNLFGGQRQQETYGLGPNRQPHNQYPRYHFHGDVMGRLHLHFEFH